MSAEIKNALRIASRARVVLQKFDGAASRVCRRLAIVFHLNHIVMASAWRDCCLLYGAGHGDNGVLRPTCVGSVMRAHRGAFRVLNKA